MTSPVHPHARGEREICLVRLSVNQRCIPTDVGNAIATNATASYIIRFFSAGTEGVPEGAGNSACSDIYPGQDSCSTVPPFHFFTAPCNR